MAILLLADKAEVDAKNNMGVTPLGSGIGLWKKHADISRITSGQQGP